MGTTGDRLRTMAGQLDSGQMDRDATAAQLRQIAGDVDRVEDGGGQQGGDVQQANQQRANAATGTQQQGNQGGQQDQNQQQGPRGSW